MKLTRKADFAIRLLIHLASDSKESTSRALAKTLNIPFNHLAKIVHELSRHGFIITKKGKGGGLKLAKNPASINVYEVVSAIEGPVVISDCILSRETCKFSKSCNFRKCLSGLKEKLEKLLITTKISDLAECK